MPKVFLGGTVNKSRWRNYVMPKLKIDYFNPVVENWDEAAYQRELHEREHCDFCLYVITPKMLGFYAIAEIVEDSIKRPDKTLFCALYKDDQNKFSPHQIKSLDKVGKMVERNGGKTFKRLDSLIDYLNSFENTLA